MDFALRGRREEEVRQCLQEAWAPGAWIGSRGKGYDKAMTCLTFGYDTFV